MLDRPELWAELVLVYDTFWHVHEERVSGFGEGFIPYAALRQFVIDADRGDPVEMLPFIRAMDRAYLKFQNDKRERERERDQRQAKRAGIHR